MFFWAFGIHFYQIQIIRHDIVELIRIGVIHSGRPERREGRSSKCGRGWGYAQCRQTSASKFGTYNFFSTAYAVNKNFTVRD